MHTYTILSKLLLQLSVPLGLLASLCILAAMLRTRLADDADDEDEDEYEDDSDDALTPGKLALWGVLSLACLGLHVLLGNWLWQASSSGEILACGKGGCLNTLVNLSGDDWGVFWFSATLYWLACIAAPLVYLYPLARWLRQAWQTRRSGRETYADTEPVEPHW